jgi:hypothetical protein
MSMRSLVLGGTVAVAVILAAAGPASAAASHGKGGKVAVSVSPGALGFGEQEVGTVSAAQSITITNTGSSAETITLSFAAGTSGDGDFSLGSPGCESDTLAAGASCSEPISFAPVTAGDLDAELYVQVGGVMEAAVTMGAMAFSGPPASVLTFSPSSLTFAPQFIDTAASAPQDVTVTNTSSQPALISGLGTTEGFGIHTDGTTCSSVTLAPGASCTVAVVFAPDTQGAVSGGLTVEVGTFPETTTSMPMTGEGLGQVVDSVSVSAGTVVAGGTLTGTVEVGPGVCQPVNAATTVDLTPDNSAISIPSQVVVPEGQCTVSFTITANPVSAATVSGFSAIDANESDPGGVNLITSEPITVEP